MVYLSICTFDRSHKIWHMTRLFFALICLAVCAIGCYPDLTEVDLDEFRLRDGHQIRLIAQEPMIQSPVAMAQDIRGGLWVAEMRGYMRDLDGNDEDLKDGRIVRLEDTDDDGVMDSSSTIFDNLVNPRAISLVYGGILFTDSTSLIWAPIEGDQVGAKILVDSLYMLSGNLEHQPNGLYYNLDNWIYSAKSNIRYKRTPDGKWLKEPTSFRGQWGISSDHLGRLIYNHNAAPLMGDYTLPNAMLGNPYLQIEETVGNYYTDDMRLYPAQATSVNRGYNPKVLDKDKKLIHYTSACSPLIYYGHGLSDEYEGSAFVCAPEANLISNYTIDHVSLSATKDSTKEEFLVSMDETFRPVSLITGFEDALYVIDMRKGVIQHSAYMSSYLREKIKEKKLDKVVEKGRIYKIEQNGYDNQIIDLADIQSANLPGLLRSPNLSLRLWAQKQITHNRDLSIVNQLGSIAKDLSNPTAAIHAWWALDDLGSMDHLVDFDATKITPEFCIGILPLLAKHNDRWSAETTHRIYQRMIMMNIRAIDINLAPNIGQRADFMDLFWQLADRHQQDKSITEALVSGSLTFAQSYQQQAKTKGLDLLTDLYKKCLANKKLGVVKTPSIQNPIDEDNRTEGLHKFRQYCVSCHGYDGNGLKNIAPSLIKSKILKGPEQEIARVILRGYQSGSNEFQMMMPAYINDPNMTDKDVSGIVSYLISTFAERWGGISEEEVAKIRLEEPE